MTRETTKTVAFKTIGCRLNQYETDALITQFHNAGYKIAGKGEKAGVVIVNTCTVTHQSDKKSKYAINKAAADNPDALIIAAGCLVDNQKETLEKKTNITLSVDNKRKSSIFQMVDALLKGEMIHPENYSDNVFGFETGVKGVHTRTFIKIQDGCNNYCTFCIVPMVRGKAVSRKPSAIIDNLKQIVDKGFREIVLTGVNIGRYDFEGTKFEDLLKMILRVEGDFRVRISSIEPYGINKGFHELFFHPKLTPHLHLCLQSGSDYILKRMKRMYSVQTFMSIIESFKKDFPLFNFTSDIIVGFPGESQEDFIETCNIAKEAAFSHIHTFRYSRRKGTKADIMDKQIPEIIKEERSRMIQTISEENRNAYYRAMLGMTQRVLVEKTTPENLAYGYGEHYIPVVFKCDSVQNNMFNVVKLQKLNNSGEIEGKKVNK